MVRFRIAAALTLAPLLLTLAACDEAPSTVEPLDPAEFVAARSTGTGLPAFDPVMAELGDEIFEDANLSINRNQACETCHDAEWGFTGPLSDINAAGAVYPGSFPDRFGNRKPPSSAYSTLSPVFDWSRRGGGLFVGGNFWDGRSTGERLGSPAAEQAQGPFLNPVEQGLRDEACVVLRIRDSGYAWLYRDVFGDAINDIDFPENTDALCEEEGPRLTIDPLNRDRIALEYDNVALAIAMYEESHNLFSSKFDASREGKYKLAKEEQRGFALFQGKANCATCHPSSGQQPAFTDHTFANLGVPANPENPVYNDDPAFVDAGLGGFLAETSEWSHMAPETRGMMRVPTLRNVDLRPYPGAVKAYMHNGVFKSLEMVVHFYNTRDVLPDCEDLAVPEFGVNCWPAPEVPENVNTDELGDLGLTPEEEADIVAFLKTLSDGFTGNDH